MKSRMFIVAVTTIIALQTVGVIPAVVPDLSTNNEHSSYNSKVYADDLGMTQAEFEALMEEYYGPSTPEDTTADTLGMTQEEYDALMEEYYGPDNTTLGLTQEEYDALMFEYYGVEPSTNYGGMTPEEYEALMEEYYGT